MNLKQFCVNQKWCIGFAEVRRFISHGIVQVNDKVVSNADMELNVGDIVKCGRHKIATVEEN